MREQPTNTHCDEKSSHKLSKIDDRIATTFTPEVIRICTSAADPVRDGSKHIGCNNEQWVIFVP